MDLVDEKDVLGLQVGQDRRQVSRFGDHRPGRGAKTDPQFAGHDLSQRRLAQARRSVQQHMIERLAPGAGGGDENPHVFAHLDLTDEVVQGPGAQPGLGRIALGPVAGNDAVLRHRLCSPAPNSTSPPRINASTGASDPNLPPAWDTAPSASDGV